MSNKSDTTNHSTNKNTSENTKQKQRMNKEQRKNSGITGLILQNSCYECQQWMPALIKQKFTECTENFLGMPSLLIPLEITKLLCCAVNRAKDQH